MTKQVLVTGSNGFLGSSLCRELARRDYAVRGLVRATSDLSLLEDVPMQRAVGSLSDPASLVKAAQGVELVFHVAAAVTDWGTLEYFRQVNVEGTRRVLEAACQAGVKRFVYVSSVAVHSFIDASDMNEESPQLPTPFPYCQTKREAEALVRSYHDAGKIEAVIVRPGDIHGPGDRVVMLRLGKLLKTFGTLVVDGGKKLGAFAYIENLVHGMLLAAESERAAGQAYILTDGVKCSWGDYYRRLSAALGYPARQISVSGKTAWALASVFETLYRGLRIPSRPPVTRYLVTHMTNDFHFSTAKAERELGYVPPVGMDEAIQRTAEWYQRVVGEK